MEIYYSRKFYLAFIVCKKNFSKIEKKRKMRTELKTKLVSICDRTSK